MNRHAPSWEPSAWVWGFIFLFLLVSLNVVVQIGHQNDASEFEKALDACWDQFDADIPSDAVSVCQRSVYQDFERK